MENTAKLFSEVSSAQNFEVNILDFFVFLWSRFALVSLPGYARYQGHGPKKICRLGTQFYQVGHGSRPVVISGTRTGTFTVPGGLMQ